jgi:DNA-binding NtrC family response regulator
MNEYPSVSDELLFGSSEAMQKLRFLVDNVARAVPAVLIEGESGTGKEVLARAIHLRSPRRSRAFVKVACSERRQIPPAGSFRGGAIETTAAGTVLFDEVGELDASGQAEVMELLNEWGSGRTDDDVHIVCTTRAALDTQLASGTFRPDLYDRIAAITLRLPPLRERRVDIPSLAHHFLNVHSELYRRKPEPFSDDLMNVFLTAEWPGNIRELENAVKQYVSSGSAETIIARLEANVYDDPARTLSLKLLTRNAVRNCEYNAIVATLNRNHWNRRNTAQELHVSYRSLLYLMKQLGLSARRGTAPPAEPSQPSSDTNPSAD